ncbi:MAG TPA: hypothetical protein PKH02_00415 [Bacteroidales bacterium]|nr:hypothetical protein [Bacteroidales bacterium]
MSELNNHKRATEVAIISALFVAIAGMTAGSCTKVILPKVAPGTDVDILMKNIFDSRYIPSPLNENAKASHKELLMSIK